PGTFGVPGPESFPVGVEPIEVGLRPIPRMLQFVDGEGGSVRSRTTGPMRAPWWSVIPRAGFRALLAAAALSGAAACSEIVPGDARATGVLEIGDCTAAPVGMGVHRGPVTLSDCADPAATQQVVAVGDGARDYDCADFEGLIIISGIGIRGGDILHACTRPNLSVGSCYTVLARLFTYSPGCTEPRAIRLVRKVPAMKDTAECDPPLAAGEQMDYIRAKVQNFIDEETGMGYCFRET
ncbi:hypothetical protein, partial [Nocardia sp. NPDC057353]|uniref:hypothetical protein n=1 Tax=Nocardia sp. NPDC057353 TaxID=3346104 RepID=UPI00363BE337